MPSSGDRVAGEWSEHSRSWSFSGKYDPGVVFVETMASSLYIENDAEVHRYSLVFDQLRAMALGPDESLAVISRISERL
ncbi:Scr1 family TA system antitoxin-like transcriptional regulator [Sphaerisporangium sp. NPDC049002]|uniref:Scr1 family TA system antitoxin-like transcriptional regulator n=1 Tax=Sphaerisporangium sp. NPDC049002 TaxID=3155392 RepID=UPI0033DE1375